MAKKLYEESNIQSIANAIRVYTGDTKIAYAPNTTPIVRVSRTENATSFTDYNTSPGYGNKQDLYDVVSIKGAAKLRVKMAYQTESEKYDYVQVMEGDTADPTGTAYGGQTLTNVELDINGDTVTFYFHSDSSICTYMGYYAEVQGYDAEGHALSEVPNTYKVAEMSGGIAEIGSAIVGAYDKVISSIFDGSAKALDIPSGTEKLYKCCCYERDELESATIPETVTYIGDKAFYDCDSLRSVNLPSGLTFLGGYVFYGCEKLSITDLPVGVTIIDLYTFYKNAMTNFTIHKDVATVKRSAFEACGQLATVTFKGTPSSIADDVFTDCTNLATINVPWAEGAVANAPWGAPNATINYNYKG